MAAINRQNWLTNTEQPRQNRSVGGESQGRSIGEAIQHTRDPGQDIQASELAGSVHTLPKEKQRLKLVQGPSEYEVVMKSPI